MTTTTTTTLVLMVSDIASYKYMHDDTIIICLDDDFKPSNKHTYISDFKVKSPNDCWVLYAAALLLGVVRPVVC